MLMSPKNREYDLIVLGATGYTGKLCTEYITKSLPTTLKWAIAGRSATKLATLIDQLKVFNSDRTQPGEPSITDISLYTVTVCEMKDWKPIPLTALIAFNVVLESGS